MKKGMIILLTFMLSMHVSAQDDAKQQLVKLFTDAEQCYLMDDYQQLESYIIQYGDTFKLYQSVLGDSIDVFRAYHAKMYGSFFYGLAEDDSCAFYSERYYRIALDIFNRRNNVSNAMVLREELAQLYYKQKAYGKAKEQLDSVCCYYDERLHDMGIASVKPDYYKTISQLAMCNARLGHFDTAISQIDEAINDYFKKQKDASYYEALRKRGKILMMQADSLGTTQFKKAVDCYQQYVNERCASIEREMVGMNDSQRGQYWLSMHQFLMDCYRLGRHAPEMLYNLALFSKDYLIRKNATQTKWQQVRKSLGKKDCAIEFVQYFGKDDERRLGCLVLRDYSKKPEFIDLLSTDSLLDLSLTNIHSIGSAIEYSFLDIKDSLYNDSRLARLIWSDKLMAAIGDANYIFFAPDGLVHQVAIEYLMPDLKKICYRLSSTRKLSEKYTAPSLTSALLCGGIDYDAAIKPSNRDNDVVAYRFLAPQTTTIKNLPGTRREVDSIYAMRRCPQDTLLVGEQATDAAVLQLLKRHYGIIHFATHGYFGGRVGIYNDIKPLLNDESMSKSGLLFAGASRTLTDKTFDENLFDGVLSAEELSKQDFSGTELVVLSACQTGLGRLTDDGIYGLQRGLKMAGAKAMIVSLWAVDDYSGSLLMRYFYEELEKQSSKDITIAFLNARQRLILEEREIYLLDEETLTISKRVIKYDTPQHLNPFIIIDAY